MIKNMSARGLAPIARMMGAQTSLVSLSLRMRRGNWVVRLNIHGKVKYTNDSGEQSVDFKSLEIAGGKMKAKVDMPGGEAEATIEGKFVGDNFEGTYAITPNGSTEVAGKGTLKATKTTEKKG
jgi:hypothetical protein